MSPVEDRIPTPIMNVLVILDQADFFEDGLLIGSWAMLFYQEILGVNYLLRTGDIDFAVIPEVLRTSKRTADLEADLIAEGLEPVMDRMTGLQKFLTDMYEVEFLIHRKGGKEEIKLIKKYNVNAQQMPFLDILFIDPIMIKLDSCTIRIPRPEALFFHKMIIAQRRPEESKKLKDLEQCSLLASQLDQEALASMAHSYKMSRATIKSLRASCAEIDFPPKILIPRLL